MEERICRIEWSLGRHERCPGSACPFWVRGAEARQDHCSLEALDLAGRTALAEWLSELRVRFTSRGPEATGARPGSASGAAPTAGD
jgi:hypothetical protein